VKLGIATPVVTNVAGAPLTWEKNGTIEDIGRVAETADRLGYHHMTCSEHIGLPSSETARRGARYWDPLATFGYVSARTQQIKFATMTLVLGYHHPLAIVKRYGTLDHVSGAGWSSVSASARSRRSSTFSVRRSTIGARAPTMH
jgi:alkanesulfonate monooxygenase SsuD/methylene tetrahydromethanopterin reductase-like flavin-dependent oxidoreductase (luciferase family)